MYSPQKTNEFITNRLAKLAREARMLLGMAIGIAIVVEIEDRKEAMA
jgi:hypothetical protein